MTGLGPGRSAFWFLLIAGAASGCPPRPYPGSALRNPPDIAAQAGRLSLGLTFASEQMSEFPLKICLAYAAPGGDAEAPTLRLSPGDQVDISLTNRLSYLPRNWQSPTRSEAPHDPCAGGVASPVSANLAFEGLALAPACHAGEAAITTVESGDPPFAYHFDIPPDTPPGLDLYAPHLPGSAALQLGAGASGAIVIGGMEKVHPETAGLPERILLFREQFDEPGDTTEEPRISVNFVPVNYRQRPPPALRIQPGAREFWRVANASSGTFIAFRFVVAGRTRPVELVARDGAPLSALRQTDIVSLPPGGRAEFILQGPALGQPAALRQAAPDDESSAARDLIAITAATDATEPPPMRPVAAETPWRDPRAALLAAAPTATRRLAFTEARTSTREPARAYLTPEGSAPHPVDAQTPPAFTAQGIEDWVVINRTADAQSFRLASMRFLILKANGKPLADPEWRDTVALPAWDGRSPFPSLTLRLDFRAPRLAGPHIAESSLADLTERGAMLPIDVEAPAHASIK